MYTQCKLTYSDGEQSVWTVEANIIRHHGDTCEMRIRGRGSDFTVIAGRYVNGWFMCLPEIGYGGPMAGFSDRNWNFERLARHLNRTDAATITEGLKLVGECLGLDHTGCNRNSRDER